MYLSNNIYIVLFIITELHPLDIEHHAINSVYILLNFFVCAKPVRILHAIYPAIYALLFSVFTAIYQLGGNTPPIYSFLDWTKPGLAVGYVAVLTFIGVPVIHLTFFGLYKLRIFIREKCCSSDLPAIESTENKETVNNV